MKSESTGEIFSLSNAFNARIASVGLFECHSQRLKIRTARERNELWKFSFGEFSSSFFLWLWAACSDNLANRPAEEKSFRSNSSRARPSKSAERRQQNRSTREKLFEERRQEISTERTENSANSRAAWVFWSAIWVKHLHQWTRAISSKSAESMIFLSSRIATHRPALSKSRRAASKNRSWRKFSPALRNNRINWEKCATESVGKKYSTNRKFEEEENSTKNESREFGKSRRRTEGENEFEQKHRGKAMAMMKRTETKIGKFVRKMKIIINNQISTNYSRLARHSRNVGERLEFDWDEDLSKVRSAREFSARIARSFDSNSEQIFSMKKS